MQKKRRRFSEKERFWQAQRRKGEERTNQNRNLQNGEVSKGKEKGGTNKHKRKQKGKGASKSKGKKPNEEIQKNAKIILKKGGFEVG